MAKAGSQAKPTARQLKYLRVLAEQRGETFIHPRTIREASKEIERLAFISAWKAIAAQTTGKVVPRQIEELPSGALRFEVKVRGPEGDAEVLCQSGLQVCTVGDERYRAPRQRKDQRVSAAVIKRLYEGFAGRIR